MKAFKFEGLLQNTGWIAPAFVHLDEQGQILSISNQGQESTSYELVEGYALPGMQNAHSHAFQYAMAGLNERHDLVKNPDDFWAWREAMYQLALSVNPEQMEAIATMLYAEMARHGYTSVAEFHYLHHDQTGKPYQDIAEMGMRMIAAAKTAGIKITLIPIFYQKGGFGQAASPNQGRFISKDIATYLRLFEACKAACTSYLFANIAYGIHSLRAVEPSTVQELSTIVDPSLPFHLHIAEQKKEVTDAIAYLGKRPVEWLLEHIELNDNYHLVHATHLTAQETNSLAKSKAQVVLCPSTEGNLGDGLFALQKFQADGGNWSIGTDSHIGLNPFEELRMLDYGQRLNTHRRNIFYAADQGDGAMYAMQKAVVSGRQAMGNSNRIFFEIGQYFDALVFDAKASLIATASLTNLTATILYASDVSMQYGTIVNGKWIVKKGKHRRIKKIKTSFLQTMRALGNR